ncbi:MAG: hypothetical protein H0U70_00275 [Tatlockia sp.]|nr:hypothetical protein [Tatlockia sp.]
MKSSIFYEISNFVGIIGVILILAAYFFSQTNQVSVNSSKYLISNLLGSVLITYSLIFHWNLASFIIELAWFSISVMGLLKKKEPIK